MQHLIYLLSQYRYVALFPLAVLEGPILAVIAGFLCSRGFLNPWIVLPVIVLGDMTSDSFCFFLGRRGVPEALKKIAYRMGFTPERIGRIRHFIQTHPKSFIPLSKITLGIGVLGVYMTGSSGISYKTFICICLVTSLCQYVFYLGIGVLFGHAYMRINHYINYVGSFFIILFFTVIVFYSIQSLSRRI